jgi:spore coat protein SA
MSRPLKIAYVTPGAYPLPSLKGGSVERVIEHIVPLLAGSVEPRIYGRTAIGLPRKGVWNGVVCERFAAANKSRYAMAVSRALTAFKPDIIQVENRPHLLIRLSRQHPYARMWLNLHSSTFIQPRHISKLQLRRSFQIAEKIIVNSDYLRSIVVEQLPEAASKIVVVHLGADTRLFPYVQSPEGSARRSRLRLANGWTDRKVILYLGRLIPLKGVHHLIELMPRLLKRHPNAVLVIVGSPQYGSKRTSVYSRRLKRAAERLGGSVRFVPYVPYNEVPDWLLGADVLAMPSVRREAFGLVNVEAMAAGIPVVASRIGGISEIVQDGVTGLLAEPSSLTSDMLEKLDHLLSSGQLRVEMGRRGREKAETYFSWQAAAERYVTRTGVANSP